MTPAEIYEVEGLDPSSPKSKRWLSNKLSAMRHYGLFERHYDETNSIAKRLISISLTAKGRQVVQADGAVAQTHPPVNDAVTPDTVLRDVRILRRKMPLWNVIFELKPREEDES